MQAIGVNSDGQKLLAYLKDYHPDLALDYEFIMDRLQAAEDAYNRVLRCIDSAAPLTPHTAPKPTANGIKP